LFGHYCKVHVVHDGVDWEEFNHVRNFTKSDNTVLFVGAIVPFKGLHILLDAVKILQKKGLNVRLKIVGSPYLWTPDKGHMSYYRNLLDHGRKLPNVAFEGEKCGEDLLRAYKEAAVLAVPSISEEAFGLVALEGMAAGLPVVASKIGGLTEIVKHEETGLLVPPGNVEALASALERLIENEQLRNRLAENAKGIVRKQFTWNSSFMQLCDVYSRYLDV
jgi:spore coat protein SA